MLRLMLALSRIAVILPVVAEGFVEFTSAAYHLSGFQEARSDEELQRLTVPA